VGVRVSAPFFLINYLSVFSTLYIQQQKMSFGAAIDQFLNNFIGKSNNTTFSYVQQQNLMSPAKHQTTPKTN
jgi:hypothetical protein